MGRGPGAGSMFSLSATVGCFVERRPLRVFLPCPFNVSSDSGKCFLTASAVSPGHDAYCLLMMALIHVGLVGYPAAAWRYRINSGRVFNSYVLCIASFGGGRFVRNSVGGLVTRTVSILTLLTMGTSGMRHMPVFVSRHPFMMASLLTKILVLCASYMSTVSLLNTVIYPASANLLVLTREFSWIPGVMCTSLAGWRTLYGRRPMSVAA